MRAATHNGSFHADDVFALAVLTLLHGDELEIVRTRDPELMAASDLRVDVGQRNDPATGDFDHHQRGGAGERPNGIRYASFGLVWRAFGERVCASAEIATRIDEVLVQGIDANDTGQTLTQSLIGQVSPFTVSHAVAALNPQWDDDDSPDAQREAFDAALAFAGGIVSREIHAAAAQLRAAELVRAAIGRAEDPRLVELDRGMPWHRELVPTAPEALFVVYPRDGGDWGLQAVPRVLGEFSNRKDLPERWAGRSDGELAEVTGVPDARFCHIGRFIAVAESRDGILALARQALADG